MKRGLAALILAFAAATLAAQARVTPPRNNYAPTDDVKLGRDAATQAEQQLPMLRDEALASYLDGIGRRLAVAIPRELQHSEFRYSFTVVNVKDINAFALPGGPMYVNRGMIEAAKSEGEVAGVMAHELSHVALRHGTAQASKATKYEIGAIAGQVLGAIIGGNVGSIVAQGSQFGLGAAFLRYSRDYEKQADLEGAQIMSLAGYDPQDMANMFKTIEQQSAGAGSLPEWLSDHPNPGNRYEYISQEARSLRVSNPVRDTRGFEDARARLRQMPPAPTTAEASKTAANRPRAPEAGTTTAANAEPPSAQFARYRAGTLFEVSVPDNWEQLPGSRSITFAPRGGFATKGGASLFSHGIEAGEAPANGRDVQAATDQLIASLAQANPRLQRATPYQPANVGDRRGLRVDLSNMSDLTGMPERISLYTSLLPDGHLFYLVAVSPVDQADVYSRTFDRVVASVKLSGHH